MATIRDYISDVFEKQMLTFTHIQQINLCLRCGEYNEADLQALGRLIRAVGQPGLQSSPDLVMPNQFSSTVTTLQVWQLYVLNYSQQGFGAMLDGAYASCSLPGYRIRAFSRSAQQVAQPAMEWLRENLLKLRRWSERVNPPAPKYSGFTKL